MTKYPEECTEMLFQIFEECKEESLDLFDNIAILYVNQSRWLIVLLERIIEKKLKFPSKIYNILLDLYLKIDHNSKDKAFEAKALEMLKDDSASYDTVYAMMICKKYDCKIGTLILYKKQSMFKEMLEYYMQTNEYVSVMSTCKKYGEVDASLWTKCLIYFSSKSEECLDFLKEALHHSESILSPLEIVQILGKNATLQFAIVKDLLQSHLKSQLDAIDENEKEINRYREEIKKIDADISDLKSK